MTNEELKEQGRYIPYDSNKIEDILKEHWKEKTMPIGSIQMPSTEYDTLGSNGWVIGGDHTASGKPILANDPHLALLIPSLFYLAELIVVDENNEVKHQAFGALVDGMPFVSAGVSAKFSWGSTASYVDNKDVFHEKVREKDGNL